MAIIKRLLNSINVQSSKREERPLKTKVFFQPSNHILNRLSGDKTLFCGVVYKIFTAAGAIFGNLANDAGCVRQRRRVQEGAQVAIASAKLPFSA